MGHLFKSIFIGAKLVYFQPIRFKRILGNAPKLDNFRERFPPIIVLTFFVERGRMVGKRRGSDCGRPVTLHQGTLVARQPISWGHRELGEELLVQQQVVVVRIHLARRQQITQVQ